MTTLTVLTGPLDHMASGQQQNTYLLTTSGNPLSNNNHHQQQSSSSSEDSNHQAKPSKRSRPEATRRRASRPAAAPAVARRNERERNRVRQVNLGFATLRQHVPAKTKKMSKVETLRSAVQYIKQLQQLLRDENGGGCSPQPHHQSPSSPEPSLGSDASSPYDSLSPEDEELLDFTTWLS